MDYTEFCIIFDLILSYKLRLDLSDDYLCRVLIRLFHTNFTSGTFVGYSVNPVARSRLYVPMCSLVLYNFLHDLNLYRQEHQDTDLVEVSRVIATSETS